MKLITVTWSYEDKFDYVNSVIYRSFTKNNDKKDFVNIHFNRQSYVDLENDFRLKYEYQYEYILYRIYLLKDRLKEVEDDYIIHSDTGDVVCLGNIEELNCQKDKVIFSSELNKYPPESEWNNYPSINEDKRIFLNAGVFAGSKSDVFELLDNCVQKILPLNYKDFKSDQGVYTYEFINGNKIILDDDCNLFLCTYLRSENDFEFKENRLFFKGTKKSPLFVHDNGWNYGSPKFIEKFKII